jgi:DNA repair protein RecO (recombination protein O)
MFTHFRTQGFFLKKENRGEANQLFFIFTKNFGKLKILGKAIRKITSKLRPSTVLFCLSEIEFIQGKNYKILTDALVLEKFKNLRKNSEKLVIAYKMANIIEALCGEGQKDEKIWQLLFEGFQHLNNLDNCKTEIFYYFFLWNFFSSLGYGPELYSCCVCQKKLLPETFWFLPKEGGIVCWQCFKNFSAEEKEKAEAEEIAVDAVKILRFFLKQEDWKLLKLLKISNNDLKNIEKISFSYFEFLKTI